MYCIGSNAKRVYEVLERESPTGRRRSERYRSRAREHFADIYVHLKSYASYFAGHFVQDTHCSTPYTCYSRFRALVLALRMNHEALDLESLQVFRRHIASAIPTVKSHGSAFRHTLATQPTRDHDFSIDSASIEMLCTHA
jgi:hypothetical protein